MADNPHPLAAILAGIGDREQAATEGPWRASRSNADRESDFGEVDFPRHPRAVQVRQPYFTDGGGSLVVNDADARADAAFIAGARSDVPRLLAAVEAVLAVAGDCREASWDFGADGNMRPVAWTLDPEAVREAIARELAGGEKPGGTPD